MRMLAPILFGLIFATVVGLYTAQLVSSWMHRTDHIFQQVQP